MSKSRLEWRVGLFVLIGLALLALQSSTTNLGYTFDATLASETLSFTTPLVFGQNEHRLLSVLASDFYRPFRIATLHGILYPGESFHPDQSAASREGVGRPLRCATSASTK